MNASDQFELDRIRDDQARIRDFVQGLDRRIDLLARRLHHEPAPVPPPTTGPIPPPPNPAPPKASTPPPLPVHPVPLSLSRPHPPAPARHPTLSEPLELRVGTYWMSRIGMVILLTGLVFLGNYAYHRIVPLLGPGGKLSLLALAGAALTGAGWWMEKSRETLRNYGRVLFGGGAAAIYYTTYAAHFVAGLRVIESPVVGGGLLLLLAGGIVWFAERRRSETIALLAIGLSYYTSAINPIGGFTLFSNLLLTAAGVVFLVRQGWSRLSYLTLAGTYLSYAFWRFAGGSTADLTSLGTFAVPCFLAGYWTLFSAAVFLAKPAVFHPAERAAFLTINNAAFFGLATHHLVARTPDGFWPFALVFGSALLGLAALAARRLPSERTLDGAYFAQGLFIMTAGLVAKFTGTSLAIILAIESALLISASRSRYGRICDLAGGMTSLLALAMTLREVTWASASPLVAGLGVGAIFVFNAWWSKRDRGVVDQPVLDGRAALYSLFALLIVRGLIDRLAVPPWESLMLGSVAVVGLVGFLVALPEIALLAQAGLAMGIGQFIFQQIGHSAIPAPGWLTALHAGLALGLMHWWQKQRAFVLPIAARLTLEPGCALGVISVIAVWWHVHYGLDGWMLATSLGALATLLYGLITRATALAIVGQILTLLSVLAFGTSLLHPGSSAWVTLAPIANLIATSTILRRIPKTATGNFDLAGVVFAYRGTAALLLGVWGWIHVEPTWRMAFYAALAALQILVGAFGRNRERITVGIGYAVVAFLVFWARLGAHPTAEDLLAILAIPGALRIARWWRGETVIQSPVHDALVVAATGSFWLWATTGTIEHGYGQYLTGAWALLALVIFGAGLGLRERIYRVGGFGVLALAVGRLFFLDVWRFDTLYRIVSFLILGAVLLVLSFVYHRFAETLRRWL